MRWFKKAQSQATSSFQTNPNHSAPVFLNTPIHESTKDVIGYTTSVDMLNQVIDSEADMVAISGPFGSGKTSIVELLKSSRKNRKNEKFISVQMWPHLGSGNCSDPSELHRHLTYQMAARINPRIGTYINRRNSQNYKLVTAHVNQKRFIWITALLILSILLSNVFWDLIKTLANGSKLTSLNQLIDVGLTNWIFLGVTIILKCLTIGLALWCLPKIEIALSTHKTEKSKNVEEDEIIDVFQNQVLKKHKFINRQITYIIVIEDLDRCTDYFVVCQFLKEIRKYYIPGTSLANNHQDKLKFIVSVNPEALIYSTSVNKGDTDSPEQKAYNGKPILYEKIFDYILDLQPIHTDNYETVLSGLLSPYVTALIKEGIIPKEFESKPTKAPGMNWIVWGKEISVREIKHRLNHAILTYRSLINRFPKENNDISFEKCSIVAYLTTAYEADFWATPDWVFGALVSSRMRKDITAADCKETLEKNSTHPFSESYITEIWELIRSRKIDESYRMYLFNYPQKGEMNTYSESAVKNAILWEDRASGLSHFLDTVMQTNPQIIENALMMRIGLSKPLPLLIFDYEILYCESLRTQSKAVIEAMGLLLDKATDERSIIEKIITILRFDSERKYFSEKVAREYCEIWTSKWQESILLQFRTRLCEEFSKEIIQYKSLFFDPHMLLLPKEMKYLSFVDSVRLFNINNPHCSISDIQDLLSHYRLDIGQDADNETERLILAIIPKYNPTETFDICIEYMQKRKKIIPAIEKSVYASLGKESGKAAGFDDYRNLINEIAVHQELSADTLKNIANSKNYEGFTYNVSQQMYDNGYCLEYVLMRLHSNEKIDFNSTDVMEAITDGIDKTILTDDFILLRSRVAKEAKDLWQYQFMFDKNHPIMTTDELSAIGKTLSPSELLKFWPTSLVTKQSADVFLKYWNASHKTNNVAVKILYYISELPQELSIYCFQRLNFEKTFKYFTFSAENRNKVKKQFNNILSLDSVEGMIAYIYLTRFMDEDWLIKNKKGIIGNVELEESFSKSINNCSENSITDTSINAIHEFKNYQAYTSYIEKRLRELGYLYDYTASTILRKRKLVLESTARDSELWKTYVNLFKNSTDDILNIMAENDVFVQEMMADKLYSDVDNQHRLLFANVDQTSECLVEIINGQYSIDYVTRYFTSIHGFIDIRAEKQFISFIKQYPDVSLNDEVYKHVYPLLSPSQKTAFTHLRNRKKQNPGKAIIS